MPDGMNALAASDGVVWSAMQTPRGFAVVIDHGPAQGRDVLPAPREAARHADREREDRASAFAPGSRSATIGADPLDGEHLKHLHFEVWLGGPSNAIDPAPLMHGWEIVGDANALVARNAGFLYRPIGASGDAYPGLDPRAERQSRRLRHPRRSTRARSSTSARRAGALYDTLTRHFQTWRRYKGFWRGQYGEGHDRYEPGRSVAL